VGGRRARERGVILIWFGCFRLLEARGLFVFFGVLADLGIRCTTAFVCMVFIPALLSVSYFRFFERRREI
jgi:hypothetical protein